jgi:hypothetical protein
MIKANELRINNILNYTTAENDILPTTLDWQDIKWISEDPKGFNLVHEPIPLTEEWLLKFGYKGRKDFKWNGSIVGIQIKDGKFYLGIKDLGNVLFHSVVEINTVHHFQNLYYFLTNEELSYTTKIETPGTITDKEARNFNQGA